MLWIRRSAHRWHRWKTRRAARRSPDGGSTAMTLSPAGAHRPR